MASYRTLFVAVYASNDIIRTLFLPLCYLLLISPFALAITYYFGFDKKLRQQLPQDFSLLDLLPQIALTTVFILLPTRLLSGSNNGAISKDGRRTRRVQLLPYWIPGAKHFYNLTLSGEQWLKSVRDSSISSIVQYNSAGSKHSVIFSDHLLVQVYQNWNHLENSQTYRWALLRNAFHMSNSYGDRFFELSQLLAKTIDDEMFEGKQMEGLIKSTLNILTESLPDLVTFNSSIVDQMRWERVSNIALTDGTSEAECDFFALINEFCCNAILPTIMGIQFTEAYQLLATDLSSFTHKFWPLALGLPRLTPVQGLPGAALAQKRLMRNIENLLRDMAHPLASRVPDDDESVSGDEQTDADICTPFRKINGFFNKHDVPMEIRASIVFHQVHGIISEVVPLVFWILLHIYSSSASQDAQSMGMSLVQNIMEETKKWAVASQPPSIHPSFPAPPEIKFKLSKELISKNEFPNLQSCINEARRLYTSSNMTYKIIQPLTLEEGGVAPSGESDRLELEVGSYIDIGLSRSLVNSSSVNHISPQTFKPDRFVSTPATASIVPPIDPSVPYKTALLTSLIAGITQLWDIAPAPKKTLMDHWQDVRDEAALSAEPLTAAEKKAKEEARKEWREKGGKRGRWVLPKAVDGAEVKIPQRDIRVRITRRQNLPTSSVPGRIG